MHGVSLALYAVDDGSGTAEAILRALIPRPALTRSLLPEGADAAACLTVLQADPFAVLGIGFHALDATVHIERRARNAMAEAGVGLRPIIDGAPRSLAATLTLPALERMRYSEDADVTTANFSLYTLLHAARAQGLPVRCALIRLPPALPAAASTGLLEQLLDVMERREEKARVRR